ncbi:hypothetical protein SS37A_08990 [Methylocystis iwaonis]|uniref:Transposase n=1 Tax=Methylocystis iwaonis TaxID=2885079 RepID=A0ABN6VDQ4_9HYPH|nr:hypothetical protein SS37A_08990 [Methylocystis iwaonis]
MAPPLGFIRGMPDHLGGGSPRRLCLALAVPYHTGDANAREIERKRVAPSRWIAARAIEACKAFDWRLSQFAHI